LQLPGPPILTIFSNCCTGSSYKNALNNEHKVISITYISSSSLLLHVSCAISSQPSLLGPLDHSLVTLLQPSVDFTLKMINHSFRNAALCGTSFLVFLIIPIHRHHPALLHHYALILDPMLTFLMVLSTLVLKLSFSHRLIAWNHDHSSRCLAVTGDDSISRCGSGFSAHYNIIILTYLLTYLTPHYLRTLHATVLPRDAAMLARSWES